MSSRRAAQPASARASQSSRSQRGAQYPQSPPADAGDDSFSFFNSQSSGIPSTFQPSFSVSTPYSQAPRATYAPSSSGIPSSYASDIESITGSVYSLRMPSDPHNDHEDEDEDEMPRPLTPPLHLSPHPDDSPRWRRTEPYTPGGGPLPVLRGQLTHAEVVRHCKRFRESAMRHLLASLTKDDNLENIGHGYIAHVWHLLDWNERKAVILQLVEDIENRARLMDRLTDTSTSIFVARPTVTPGTRQIDPAHDIDVHVYQPRAVKTAAMPVQEAFRVMELLWRHTIAAPHVAGFRSRVEHLMATHSPYRNLPIINLVNNIPISRFVVPTPSVPADTTLSESELRSIARRRKVAGDGLPLLRRFSEYVQRQALTAEQKRAVQNVVLDTQATCVSFSDWTGIFHREYGLAPRTAAKLTFLAIEDSELAHWPL